MRDRLIELLNRFSFVCRTDCDKIRSKNTCNNCCYGQIADHLLANGVIVPPCKVGDKVFFVHQKCDETGYEYLGISVGKCEGVSIQKDGLWMHCRYNNGLTYWHKVKEDLGKEVFLTREESEAKLKEGAE